MNAQYYLRIQSGKYVSGLGLGVEGGRSDFIVHSDSFALGNPAGGDEGVSYPFIFRNTPFTDPVTGTVFPVSAYLKSAIMDYQSVKTSHIEDLAVKTAQIDNAAITTAKIDSLAVTSAKIDNAAITTAKIGDLQVDTLKIKDNAVTVPAYVTDFSSLPYTSYAAGSLVTLGQIQLTDTAVGQSVIVFIQAVPVLNTSNLQIGANSHNVNGKLELAVYHNNTKVRSLSVASGGQGQQTVWQENEGGGGGYVTTIVDRPASLGVSPQAIPIMITATTNNPTVSVRMLVNNSGANLTKTGGISFITLGVKK